jgi:hypothetical protein
MSYRNGDKSREHRLRKAKQKKRESARELVTKSETAAKPAAAASVRKVFRPF